jgi:prophage regulatory protein
MSFRTPIGGSIMQHKKSRTPSAHTGPLGLRKPAVCELVGFSPATLVRLVARGEFPAPRKIGDRSVAWSRAEVEQWFASRPVSDLMPVPRRV